MSTVTEFHYGVGDIFLDDVTAIGKYMIPLVPTVGQKQKWAKKKHSCLRGSAGLVAVDWSALAPTSFVFTFYFPSTQLLLLSYLMKISRNSPPY